MVPAMVRHMSDTPETPLSKIMPQIAAIPRQTFNAIVGLTGKAIVGAATSGPIKGLVTNVGDRLVVEESIVKIEDLDPSYWAYWLSSTGYSNQAGAFPHCRPMHMTLLASHASMHAQVVDWLGSMQGSRS